MTELWMDDFEEYRLRPYSIIREHDMLASQVEYGDWRAKLLFDLTGGCCCADQYLSIAPIFKSNGQKLAEEPPRRYGLPPRRYGVPPRRL